MHEALSSSLGARRGRSELEGRWSVKKENTVDMHFPSPTCRRAGSHRAWRCRSEEGNTEWKKETGGSMYLLRVPLRSLGNWMLVILGEGVCAQERSPLYLHSLGSHL